MGNAVYKFYNENNELLYIGITNNFAVRLKAHTIDKSWIDEVKFIHVSGNLTRNEAHIYEINYIAKLNPKYNKDFASGGHVNFELTDLEFTKSEFHYKQIENEALQVDDLTKYLDSIVGKVMLTALDRTDLIGKVGLVDRNNSSVKKGKVRFLKNINTLNAYLTEINVLYIIVQFETSKRTDGEKKNYKSAWKVLRLSE